MPLFHTDRWAVLNQYDQPFCEYDGIDNVDNSAQADVPTEPQEEGRIYAYDKVPLPNELTLVLLFNGDYTKQNAAMDILDSAVKNTEVFKIVTPERVHENMTVVGYSGSRSATNGANSYSVTVNFREILDAQITVRTAQYSPRNPTSAPKVDEGRKQPSVLADLFGLG